MTFKHILIMYLVVLQILTSECSPSVERDIRQIGGPPSPSSKSSSCFPSFAKVNIENGKVITMSDLQLGDRVETVSPDGRTIYSEVRTFLKKDPTIITMYKSITTCLNKTITLTGNHLIYAKKSYEGQFNPINADQVAIGDEMLVQANDELSPARIINISSQTMQGAFVPLTLEGNIVVDRVVASCYASVNHDLGHLASAPIRWFPKMMEWMFGECNGFTVFANIAEEIGIWMVPHAALY